MTVRRFHPADRRGYQALREKLWPDCTDEDNHSWLARDDAATFLAFRDDGSMCGFVEVGSRPYAENCETSPVGYIEGWWVDEDMRHRGVGRALLDAAEDWARTKGYSEMASDALLDNTVSHAAHRACGYEEVERQVCFKKAL